MENRTKLVEKKVFGMLIESSKTLFLSIQAAYSLEEAFFLAKLEFEKISPNKRGLNDIVDAKISLFSSKTLTELDNTPETKDMTFGDFQPIKVNTAEDEMKEMERLMRSFEGEPPSRMMKIENRKSERKTLDIPVVPVEKAPPTPAEIKNELMLLIIKTKDVALLEENRKSFSTSEIKYIEERLK
jgi:hypothetical protein